MLCGIEIHQRIAGRKLFCGCYPSDGKGQCATFTRKLHAVLSELGELDSAVRLEAVRERSFKYGAPNRSSCLVEADEEPPREVSPDALSAALVFCQFLNSKPVDEMHIMRKNVIDGSNTSGFQRTALLGTGGAIETPSGKVRILAVCIEEESAGIVEGSEREAEYDLSRLGVPLVEIATAPDIKSGKQAQEAALAIGTLLRKTGLVQRGIGSIRQDLNVSVPEGARVEIKGVQALELIEKTVELEAARQVALAALSAEIQTLTGGKPAEQVFFDLTEIFSETKSQLVSKQLKTGAKLLGMKLPKLAGILGKEILPGRRFGTELSDYAKSTGLRGIIHSDESMEKYGFSEDEISESSAAMSIGKTDAFVMVVGDEKRARAALSEVASRASYKGVPGETRRANPDGTSSYMRPLPGKARLYPETDLTPVQITKEMIRTASLMVKKIGEAHEEKEELLSSLNSDLSSQLSSARGLISHNPSFPSSSSSPTPELAAFAEAVKQGVDPKLAASAITNTLQSLKREGADTKQLDEPRLLSALLLCKNSKITKAAIANVLKEMCNDSGATAEGAAKKLGIEKITGSALEKLLKEEKLELSGLMAKYRLQVDAQEAQEIIKNR